MSIALIINGVTYNYPENNGEDWAVNATNWAQAVTQGMLQKAGGAFTLTAEVDFGATFGLKSVYYKSRTANPATAGQVRLANADTIDFRDVGNTANLPLAINGSNQLTFNGNVIATGSAGDVTGPGSSTDNAVTRFDSTTGKLIQNSVVIVGDTGAMTGVASLNGVTSTEIGYVSGVTSAIQTQLNTKVTGPSSSTDNAITRFDSTTGKLVQNSVVTVDDSGNLAGILSADASSANNLRNSTTKSLDITTTTLGNMVIAPSSGSVTTTSGTYGNINQQSVNIVTRGNPVKVYFIVGTFRVTCSTSGYTSGQLQLLRDNTTVVAADVTFGGVAPSGGGTLCEIPASSILFIDDQVAGTYNYKVQMRTGTGSGTITIGAINVKMVAEEVV